MKNASLLRPSLQDFVREISQGNRVVLAQAITLIESKLDEDRALAEQLIEIFKEIEMRFCIISFSSEICVPVAKKPGTN